VDLRTRNGHRSKRYISYDYQEAGPSNNSGNDDNEMYNPKLSDDIEMDDNEMEYDQEPEPLSERNYSFLTKTLPVLELENFPKVKKGKISE